jgi:hypothetical protein
MSYMVDKSPAEDKLLQRQVRVWEPKEHRPTLTWSRSGYKPYSTYVATHARHYKNGANHSTESRTSIRRGRRWPRRDSRRQAACVLSIVHMKNERIQFSPLKLALRTL